MPNSESSQTDPIAAFDLDQAKSLVRAALAPNESEFFKAYLGQASPGLGDYLIPEGRFTRARELRDKITGMVATEAFKQSQAPSVGDAQTLFPGHNELIPSQAYKAIPQAPLQSNEMPTLQGINREVVPDTRFQGPMPGVMTPLGEAAVKWFGATNENPLNREDTKNFSERGPEFYQEGPRPTRVAETGVYGPETAPSQSIELDKSMKLPPAFQAQLGALQHQLAQRQPAAHSVTEAELNLLNQRRLEEIVATGKENYPGERGILESRLSIYNKENRPNSTPALTEEAKLKQEKAKGDTAEQREMAELGEIDARTKKYITDEYETRYLLESRKRKLDAEARQADAMGGKESMKAYFQEQSALLGRAERMMNMAIEGRKSGKMDDKAYTFLMNEALADMNVNAQAIPAERSFFQEHFGTKGAVDVGPRSGAEPMRRMPGAPYSWTNPGGQQGATGLQAPLQAPAPVQDDKAVQEEADLKAFGRTLKEGETKTFKGSRWMRKGGKLIEVK